MGVYIFCFKQKTAYEVRIRDWSSDVCSSDLAGGRQLGAVCMETMVAMQPAGVVAGAVAYHRVARQAVAQPGQHLAILEIARQRARRFGPVQETGRASGREKVWPYV